MVSDLSLEARKQLFLGIHSGNMANEKAGQSPTYSPPVMRKRDCAFLTYLQTGYATAT